MEFYILKFIFLIKNFSDDLFYVIFFVESGDYNYQSHLEFFLRRSTSALTIMATSSLNETVGFQLNASFAFVASPIRKSTSAGLIYSLDVLTYFFQFVILTALKACSTNSRTE